MGKGKGLKRGEAGDCQEIGEAGDCPGISEEEIKKLLECPICFELTPPPIFQCSNGHSICNKCKEKQKICPSCKAPFTQVRNRTAECLHELLDKCVVKCRYRDRGCPLEMTRRELFEHHKVCDCRPCIDHSKIQVYPNPYGNNRQPGRSFQQGNSAPYPYATSYPPALGQTLYPSDPWQVPGYPPYLGYPGYPSALAYLPVTNAYPASGYAPPYPQQASGYPTLSSYPSAPVTQLGSAPGQGQSSGVQQYQEIPTVYSSLFDATSDALVLGKAINEFCRDEVEIINILGRRSSNQRRQIAQAFKTGFGRNLLEDLLKSELGKRLEAVILVMMTPRTELLAKELNKAICDNDARKKVLVDILCTANNNEILDINATYQRLFNKSLESDLTGDTSDHFRRLLVSLNTASRSEDRFTSSAIASKDAQELYKTGDNKLSVESTFMILATRSYAQIRLMLQEYERLSGHSLEKAIQKGFSGDVETGLLAVVKSARNRAAYFAERLHDSLAGMGTKDDDLIFIVVTRAEIDMENIKQMYNRMYHKSLAQDISDDSGIYEKVLMALIGN